MSETMATRRRRHDEQEGLHLRPGGALVPGLRRLRDPVGRPGLHAGARHRAAQDRLRVRHRVQRPVHVLHGHLRDARGARPRAGPRDGHRDGTTRPVGVGGHRRRRRPVDRWEPSDPRAAPQREPEDPAVQQPDLRPHEGSVLADERGGQGHEVHAVRLDRSPLQPDRRWRSAPRGPSSRERSTTTASTSPRSCARRRTTKGRRSWRSTRTATCSTTARSTCCATSRGRPQPDQAGRRRAHHVRRGQPLRLGRGQRPARHHEHRRDAPDRDRRARRGRPALARRSRSRTCRTGRPSRRASGCSASSSDRCTARRCAAQVAAGDRASGQGRPAHAAARRRHLDRVASRSGPRSAIAAGRNRASASAETASTARSSSTRLRQHRRGTGPRRPRVVAGRRRRGSPACRPRPCARGRGDGSPGRPEQFEPAPMRNPRSSRAIARVAASSPSTEKHTRCGVRWVG